MSAHDHPLRGAFRVTTTKLDPDWNTVYRRELPRIYNYFRYRFGDDALAEDLTSATFEKAWRAREQYRRDLAGFATWLFTIARNLATDHLRTRARTADEGRSIPYDALDQVPAPGSPYEGYTRQAEVEHLGALLNGLNEHERELVALKYGAELTNREIARALGMSESNVGTTLYRIVNKLKARWSD